MSVGYGDLHPTKDSTKILAIFFVPFAVAYVSSAVGSVANAIVMEEQIKRQQWLMSRDLTVADLALMNTDEDGDVSKLEYVEYMLKAMKVVDQNLLDNIHASFKKLDSDGNGTLQRLDIELAARRRVSCERKFNLAASNLMSAVPSSKSKEEKTEKVVRNATVKLKGLMERGRRNGSKVGIQESPTNNPLILTIAEGAAESEGLV